MIQRGVIVRNRVIHRQYIKVCIVSFLLVRGGDPPRERVQRVYGRRQVSGGKVRAECLAIGMDLGAHRGHVPDQLRNEITRSRRRLGSSRVFGACVVGRRSEDPSLLKRLTNGCDALSQRLLLNLVGQEGLVYRGARQHGRAYI